MNRDAECHDIVDGFSCHDIVDTQQIDLTFAPLLLPRGPQPSENKIVPFSSDLLRLANALSALYPKEKEEKRLIRALLRGATAMAPGS